MARAAAPVFDKPIWGLLSLQASDSRESAMPTFNTITVTRDGQIATVTIQPHLWPGLELRAAQLLPTWAARGWARHKHAV